MLLLLSSTAPAAVFAGPAPEEIITTATRTPQSAYRVGSSVTVIDAEDIKRRQALFVHEALAAAPGVVVNQNGAFGGVATVRLRGLRTEQTLVMLDGVVVNDPSSPSGGFNFATLDPNDVARIEVLRGAQSTLYGSDAIGGVINIITKQGEEGLALDGFAEGGAYNTWRGGMTLKGADRGFDYRLSLSGITSDGISKADARDGNSEKDGYKDVTISGRVGYAFSAAFRLDGNLRYSDSTSEFDSFGFVTGVTDGDQRSTAEELTAQTRALVTLLDGRFENILSLSHSRIERDNFTNDAFVFGATGKRDAAEYQGNVRLMTEATLTFGAKHEVTRIRTATENADIAINGYYAQLHVIPVEALSLVGGVRLDDHETFGSVTTARFTAAYRLTDMGTTLRGSWGEGFKAPTPFQLTFFCCGAPGPNANLQPEKSRGWDVGVEQTLWHDRVTVSLTYFRQATRNLIDFAFPAGYINIARTRTKGVEAGVSLKLATWALLDAAYTRTIATDRASGLQLILVPKDQANVALHLEPFERLVMTLEGRYVGRKRDSFGIVDDWVRLDARVRYKLTEAWEVYGRVENLLDEQYQEVFGFGTPGISVYGGLRAAF